MHPPHHRIFLAVLLCVAATMAAAPSLADGPVTDCVARDNARPICTFSNPEDMVPLPGNQALLIGQYGEAGSGHSGGLVVFELESEEVRSVFRGGAEAAVAEPGWGDPACTTAPTSAFNSHGIDLVYRDDGRLALLVVQHGGREAIEFFEVLGEGTDWKVEWRGCVTAPADASLNEVAALPGGGFYTTKMASLSGALDLEGGFPTAPTGHAYAWTAKEGFRVIAGTEGVMPNGIAASADGTLIYMNASGESSIRKVEVATGRELGRASVETPDNVTWAPNGSLLVASLGNPELQEFSECTAQTEGACSLPFKIVAVDPGSMTTLGTIYESDGRPMGAGTVGLQVGQELFVGSFRGDRILRVQLDEE